MANRVTTIFDAVDRGLTDAVNRIKTSMAGADTATGKMKAGFSGLIAEFRNSRDAQVAVATGALAIGVASVKAASDLEESMNAVDVTFGRAAEGIHDLGEDSAESYGMSERAFNQFATQFSAFADKIANESGRSVVDVVDEMTTRIADFASVHNLSMEEAAQVAQSTLAGETESFRRYGGDVSAATVETYAYASGIAEAGTALTEQQKIMARYGLFMEQTTDTAGDFARTQDSLANSMRIAQANLEDLAAKFGTYLTPAIADALSTTNEFAGALEDLDGAVGTVTGSGLADWFSRIANNTGPLGAIRRMGDALGFVKGRVDDLLSSESELKDSIFGQAMGFVDLEVATEEVAEATVDLGDKAQNAGLKIGDLQSASEALDRAYQELREEAKRLTDEYKEQRDRINDLIGRKNALVGGDIAVRQAQRDARTAADELNEALEDQSLELSDLAPIIDNATQAQLDAAQAAADRRAAELEANGTLVDSKVRNQLLKEELTSLAGTVDGPLRNAILRYIDDLNRIPSSVNTNITQNGTDDRRFGNQSFSGTPLGGNKDTGVIVSQQSAGKQLPPINLTVNAGIGTDGRQVGRQIVEALEAFFRSGGQLPPTMAQRLGG